VDQIYFNESKLEFAGQKLETLQVRPGTLYQFVHIYGDVEINSICTISSTRSRVGTNIQDV